MERPSAAAAAGGSFKYVSKMSMFRALSAPIDQVAVHVRAPAHKVQAHGVFDEGLHLSRGLVPPPAQEQRPGRSIGCAPMRHTYFCTGTHAPRFEVCTCRSPVQRAPKKTMNRSVPTRHDFPVGQTTREVD